MEKKEFLENLKKVSPGTALRTVINDLIRADLGALIVFDSPQLAEIIEGGFKVNSRFTSQRVFELCKMDGAIIVSHDLKKILYANVLLVPDVKIETNETGTRHKAAERTAKQANTFVITVSERKKKTTLYFSDIKYHLRESEELLSEVGSNLQILEKQRELFDGLLNKLNILETSSLVSVNDVCGLIQRIEIILKISEAIKKYFTELGKEGNIMNIRYKELTRGVEKTEEKLIRDYSMMSLKKTKAILDRLSFDELSDLGEIARRIIGKPLEETLSPRGYRFLAFLDLDDKDSSEIVSHFKNLDNLFQANIQDFEKIMKPGSDIKKEIEDLRNQVLSSKAVY